MMTHSSLDRARHLRKEQTPAEKIFWSAVRNRQLGGLKFWRQSVIEFESWGKNRYFIADFEIKTHKIVIEIDGSVHLTQLDYDTFRTMIIEELGYRILRFTNVEVQTDLEGCLKRVLEVVRV